MYGVEAMTGRGGLASQAAYNPHVASALGIRPSTAGIIGMAPESGLTLPHVPATAIGGGGVALPAVSPDGRHVERPWEHLADDWRDILDWHNSPAPWILLAILVYYGWTHASLRRRG